MAYGFNLTPNGIVITTSDNNTSLIVTTSSTINTVNNVSGDTTYSESFLSILGGSVSGLTNFNNGLNTNSLTATTISATTYYGLPYDNDPYLPLSGGTVTGTTYFKNGLSGNSISATTLYGNGSNLTNFTSNQITTALGYTPQQSLNGGLGVVFSNTGSISYISGGANQYLRGDGVLADFPTSAGGGGGSIYYFNGSVSEGIISGNTYSQVSKIPTGNTTSNFTATTNGDFAYFLTDPLSPDQVSIPAGVWTFQMFFSTTSTASIPSIVAKIYKYTTGGTLTLVGTSEGENIDTGSMVDLHYFAASITGTSLNNTDRIAFIFNISNLESGKNVILYTQNNTLSSVNTTFPVGIGSLNGLTPSTQYFSIGTSGTSFNINSTNNTHTFNIPLASTTGVTGGLISNTDYNKFNTKVAGTGTTNQIAYWNSNSGITSSNNLTFDGTNINLNGGLTTTSISATTYYNLPSDIDPYLSLSGGTITGLTIFNSGLTTTTDITVNGINIGLGGGQKNTNITIGLGTTFTANTTGANNIAIGRNTMIGNTVGSTNTAIGYQSLQNSDSANNNTAIGAYSLWKYSGLTGGSFNTFIGYVAGGYGLSGSSNTGVGQYTLAYASGVGTVYNTAIGANAGIYMQSGYSNTIVGNNAMYGTNSTTGNIGFGNTLIGDSSARTMLSGSKNTLIGLNSGRGIITGSSNTIIGSYYGVNPMNNNVILSDGDGNVIFQWNGTNNIFNGPISATTYLNLPLDITVTGGTYSNGTLSLTNNTGGTFSVTGFSTGGSFTGGTVTGATIFTNGLTANTLSVSTLTGTTSRMLEISSGGTVAANTMIISAYLTSGSTVANLLETTSNWDIDGNYTGSTITGTYQGQKHYNNNYLFEAVADNLFIRLIRG